MIIAVTLHSLENQIFNYAHELLENHLEKSLAESELQPGQYYWLVGGVRLCNAYRVVSGE
jgi:hypothetical protein